MNLILGGSGQVGSTIIETLVANEPIRAAIRNKSKAKKLRDKGIKVKIADYLDNEELKKAFKGIETAFLMTPENMKSQDIFEENKLLLQNYKNGIQAHQVQKIVGLSSMGAQHNRDTGNLLLSHNLEKLDSETLKTRIFLRPAYYFSNWLHYLPLIQKEGILPSFFPSDLKIPMVSPKDVGYLAAKLIKNKKLDSQTIPLEGPESYSVNDIAEIFSEVLKKNISPMSIRPEKWEKSLDNAGFSKSAQNGIIKMTEAVINGKTEPERKPQKAETTFYEYLNEEIN